MKILPRGHQDVFHQQPGHFGSQIMMPLWEQIRDTHGSNHSPAKGELHRAIATDVGNQVLEVLRAEIIDESV